MNDATPATPPQAETLTAPWRFEVKLRCFKQPAKLTTPPDYFAQDFDLPAGATAEEVVAVVDAWLGYLDGVVRAVIAVRVSATRFEIFCDGELDGTVDLVGAPIPDRDCECGCNDVDDDARPFNPEREFNTGAER